MLLTELSGSQAGLFFEIADKKGGRGIPAICGNFSDTHIAECQQLNGSVQPELDHISDRTFAGAFFKLPDQRVLIHIENSGKVIKRTLFLPEYTGSPKQIPVEISV